MKLWILVLLAIVSLLGCSGEPKPSAPNEPLAITPPAQSTSDEATPPAHESESAKAPDAPAVVDTPKSSSSEPTPTPEESTAGPTPTRQESSTEAAIVAPAPTSTPAPTPTPTSTPTSTPFTPAKPLDFTPTRQFDSFSESEQSAFAEALEREFSAAFIKSGVSAAVFDGSRLWTSALGQAATNKAMTPETPMIIRSTSKTFLGALITSQVDSGLYGLDDTIASLLSDHEDYALINIERVNVEATVRQLLTMTSGIHDWSSQGDLNNRIRIMMDPDWKPAINLQYISKDFVDPGSYYYSYANSILLGLIAAHKGGKSLNTIYEETYFAPLGIVAGLLPDVATPPDMAVSYDDLALYQGGTGFGPMNSGSLAQFYGQDPKISWAGAGIVSTPENIAQWGYQLFSPSGSAVSNRVRQSLIDAMTVPTDAGLTMLGMHTYGHYMGTGEVGTSDGTLVNVYTHPGGGGGRTSWLYYSPELDVSISLLANSQMLHEPGSCNYRGRVFMTNGECVGGGIFSKLQGK